MPAPGARTDLTPTDYALFVLVVATLGLSWIAVHYQVGPVAPEVSVLWRFVIAIPITFALALLRRERLRFTAPEHAISAMLGLLMFSAYFVLSIYAAKFIASGLISVVMSLVVALNVALSAIFLAIPVSRRIAAGGVLGILGVAAVFSPQLRGTEFNAQAAAGLGISLVAMLVYSIGNILSARLQRRGATIFATNGYAMIYGGAALLAFIVLRGLPFAIDWSLPYVLSTLYLSIVISVVTSVAFLGLIGRIGPDRAAYALVSVPILALTVSAAVEGYVPDAISLIGIVLALIGNVMVLSPRRV